MTEGNIYPLMGIKIFEKLEYMELDIIDKIVFPSKFDAGDIILKEGTHGTSMHFVVDGTLEVIKQNKDGNQAIITTVSPGESVGEMALIAGFVRSTSVQAKTDGSLLTLKRDNFETLQEEHPKIGIKVLKGICSLLSLNLRKTSEELTKLMLPLT